MRVVIIGWYGTETIGDRAILAGILQCLSAGANVTEVFLGSLYPFFTNRTIEEDAGFWSRACQREIDVSVFDSSDAKQLKNAIIASDAVVMGGGPLMHIKELFMVEFAFEVARKRNITAMILGCGVGPVFDSMFHAALKRIFSLANVILLRDRQSYQTAGRLNFINESNDLEPLRTALDPAVFACRFFLSESKNNNLLTGEHCCVNFRSFPSGYSNRDGAVEIEAFLEKYLSKFSDFFAENSIKLIPMHYFYIGDDDRYFLNKLKRRIHKNNLEVINTPLTMEEVFSLFQNAKFNVGMRFHSVVLQTCLSGRNCILDYTEVGIGKISGFCDAVGLHKSSGRYMSLQDGELILPEEWEAEEFSVKSEVIEESYQKYLNAITGGL